MRKVFHWRYNWIFIVLIHINLTRERIINKTLYYTYVVSIFFSTYKYAKQSVGPISENMTYGPHMCMHQDLARSFDRTPALYIT